MRNTYPCRHCGASDNRFLRQFDRAGHQTWKIRVECRSCGHLVSGQWAPQTPENIAAIEGDYSPPDNHPLIDARQGRLF